MDQSKPQTGICEHCGRPFPADLLDLEAPPATDGDPQASAAADGGPSPHGSVVAPLRSVIDPVAAGRKARRRDGATAKSAAKLAYPQGGQRRAIFLALAEFGLQGATTEELATETGIRYQSASTRVSELKDGKWIEPSGLTRLTSGNVQADVLRLTPAGSVQLERERADDRVAA